MSATRLSILANEIERLMAACDTPPATDAGILLPWKLKAESELREYLHINAARIVEALRWAPPTARAEEDAWNRICPRCGISPQGPCGWPNDCPVGLPPMNNGSSK